MKKDNLSIINNELAKQEKETKEETFAPYLGEILQSEFRANIEKMGHC